MTRRLTVLFALLAAVITPALASAGTVTLTDYALGDPNFVNNAYVDVTVAGTRYAGYGGPFEATTNGGPLGIASFVTFCLEINEDFSYGTSYNYDLNSAAVNGGLGGGNPDPVSDQTKYLYYHAVIGDYASVFSAAGVAVDSNAGAEIQYAIWSLENELTDAQATASGSVGVAGLKLASYALLASTDLSTPDYTIYALNITDGAGCPLAGGPGCHQDQLAYIHTTTVRTGDSPVPEPGSFVLLGTGLLAASRLLIRRKTRA